MGSKRKIAAIVAGVIGSVAIVASAVVATAYFLDQRSIEKAGPATADPDPTPAPAPDEPRRPTGKLIDLVLPNGLRLRLDVRRHDARGGPVILDGPQRAPHANAAVAQRPRTTIGDQPVEIPTEAVPVPAPGPFPLPGEGCIESGSANLLIEDDDATSQWGTSVADKLADDEVAIGSWGSFPHTAERMLLVVVAQVDPRAVAADFALGNIFVPADAVKQGFAVAVVENPPQNVNPGGPVAKVTVRYEDGRVRSGDLVDFWNRVACRPDNGPGFPEPTAPPVPSLPKAGEQPADPAGAETMIGERLSLLFSLGPEQDAERLSYLDDPTGVADALIAVRDPGSIAAQVQGEISVNITEIVFSSTTNAWFRYDLQAGQFSFTAQTGRARIIDGEWKITRATYCQDLGKGGGNCGP